MDETLMTYLRNIISLEQAVYVETNVTKRLRGGRAGVDTRRHVVKEPVKPPKHVGVDWDAWFTVAVFGTPIFAIAGALLWLTGELIGKTSESIRLQEYSAEQSAIAAYNTAQAANEAGVCKWMMFLK